MATGTVNTSRGKGSKGAEGTAGTPPKRTHSEAVAHIRESRKGVTLGGLKIKDLTHEWPKPTRGEARANPCKARSTRSPPTHHRS